MRLRTPRTPRPPHPDPPHGARRTEGRARELRCRRYDYDAPISEGGAHGFGSDGADKFAAIAAVLAAPSHLARLRWFGQPAAAPPAPPPPELPLPPRAAASAVRLTQASGFLEAASILSPTLASSGDAQPPAGVERVGCFGGGFALFEASLAEGVPRAGAMLTLPALHDRALIFVARPHAASRTYVGTIERTDAGAHVALPPLPRRATLTILLELLGRINFSHGMDDGRFGLLGGVRLDGQPAAVEQPAGWTTRCLDLSPASLEQLQWQPRGSMTAGPTFFRATFEASGDAFLHLPGFTKGAAWVNGFALGRYWATRGPQQTLYVPAPVLAQTAGRARRHELIVLELHNASANATVELVDHAIWAVPPKPPPQCDPPKAGDTLKMYSCGIYGSPLSSHQLWTFDAAGRLSFDGQLCVSVGPGTDPTHGFLLAELQPCDATDARQQLAPRTNATTSDPQQMVNAGRGGGGHGRGACLDVSNHDKDEGAPVGFWACTSGSANELWTRSPPAFGPEASAREASATRLVIQESGKCLTAC